MYSCVAESDHTYHQKILTGRHGCTVTSSAVYPLSVRSLVLVMEYTALSFYLSLIACEWSKQLKMERVETAS